MNDMRVLLEATHFITFWLVSWKLRRCYVSFITFGIFSQYFQYMLLSYDQLPSFIVDRSRHGQMLNESQRA